MAYGQSKLEAEQLVLRSYERGDLQTVIVRPPWFYGPFQPARQTQFLAAVRRGRFPLVGDGTQQRSMVFTGNLVHGMLLAEIGAAGAGQRVLDRRRGAVRAPRRSSRPSGPRSAPRASTSTERRPDSHPGSRRVDRGGARTSSCRSGVGTCRLCTCSAS